MTEDFEQKGLLWGLVAGMLYLMKMPFILVFIPFGMSCYCFVKDIFGGLTKK